MSKITHIRGREILDSRGNPTVEVEVEVENGMSARAAVPSGASTGSYEALELRDGDPKRYFGKGVLKAVSHVNDDIPKAVVGMEVSAQKEIDQRMNQLDGTANKSNLGANAILGVSLASARVAAKELGLPLYKYIAEIFELSKDGFSIPIPMFNVINGGMHSDSGLSLQEYMLVPNGISKFSEQLRAGSEIFQSLKKLLSKIGYGTSVGDEGGFAPKLESNTQPLEVISRAVTEAGYKFGAQVNTGVDAAASSFFNEKENVYTLKPENASLAREALINLYADWIEKFHVILVEDGLHENDWEGWKIMHKKLGEKALIIGDDLLATNVSRLRTAISEKACNAVLIKVNQIGTLSETIDCIQLAKKNNMKTIMSHRSGETTDDIIADLAVGAGTDFIKSGSLSRGERIAKYNRLLRIEEDI